jgi:hypothetical protein
VGGFFDWKVPTWEEQNSAELQIRTEEEGSQKRVHLFFKKLASLRKTKNKRKGKK